MRAPRVEDETRVRYLRSSDGRRARELIQVWKSELTGREFEVWKSNSFASSRDLRPGSLGFLSFASGAPAVTERPLERSERLGRYYERKRREAQLRGGGGSGGGSGGRRPSGAGWLLIAVLVLVILWALL
ncbi:MAG: hypothetical protein WD273_13170 [Trueperaceae bacterium]